jgi:hypothetical protein
MVVARVLAAAALLFATPLAHAQSGYTGSWDTNPTPRDGKMDQAVADTLYASFKRRGLANQAAVASTLNSVWQQIRDDAVYFQYCFSDLGGQPGVLGWHGLLRCALEIPFPFLVGRGLSEYNPANWNKGGGDYGGGGAHGGGWRDDCEEFEYALDAQGHLIIPSAPLLPGTRGVGLNLAVQAGQANANTLDVNKYYYNGHLGINGMYSSRVQSDNLEAVIKYQLHKINGGLPSKLDWFGIREKRWNSIPGGYDEICLGFSTVAYRRPNGSVAPRINEDVCVHARALENGHDERSIYPYDVEHKPCPFTGQSGGDFHFYGDDPAHDHHWDKCTMYAPNLDLGPDGYAINPKSTLNISAFPIHLPEHLKACKINLELLRKLADGFFKKAAKKPGYTGIPYEPVKPEDVRPGDTKLIDIADPPGRAPDGTPTAPPAPNTEAPPPAPPPGSTPPPTSTDVCDFGPTGCTDPGVGEPGLGDAPTGMMDGLFDWLPDLPSISLDTSGAACPTWALDASSFGGADWAWTMESHCDLMESNRAAIGVLFMALFGFMSALIILRA